MRVFFDYFRVLTTVFAVAGALVAVVSVARHPNLPAIEANASAPVENRVARLGSTAQYYHMTDREADSDKTTIGPKSAVRMYGGSVATDFLNL